MASYNAQPKAPGGTFYYPRYTTPVMQPYNPPVNRRPVYLRFLRAFAVAALVWFLCACLFSTVHFWTRRHRQPGIYPIPPHVTLEHCVSYEDWSPSQGSLSATSASVTTLDLPLSAEALLLLSRGPNSAGTVEILTSPEQDQDAATVQVVVSYFRESARDEAKVCQILRRDGAIGVGIFTREGPYNLANRLHFTTKVILPELSSQSPLLIKRFETDVSNTAHRVEDLDRKVLFQNLLLRGSNADIDVESVQADQGVIVTSNASIRGIFNTSSSLLLTTSNGRVEADIGLSSISGSEPKVNVITSNAAVTSRISLISDTSLGGSFKVDTITSNGRLDIDFPAAPPNSILRFIGKTSNSRAVVSLNPAYEGEFFLQTSNSKPRIYQDNTVVDPSGKNRKRLLNVQHSWKGLASGDVYWGDAEDSKATGSVFIHSSNARVDLNV